MADATVAPAAKKASLVGKLAACVSRHAYLSLGVIVLLVILVLFLIVYYRGLFMLGPYAGRSGKKRASSDAHSGGDTAKGDQGDPETERLISEINSS